jgi:hypothetical protein
MSSQTDSVQPPRIAVWLVSLFTPVGDVESIQGDLLEEFSQVASEKGIASARRWYWRQTVRTTAHLVGAGFRTAPWTITVVVAAGFLLRWSVSWLSDPAINRAIDAALDRYRLYEHDPQAYIFWLTSSMLVVRLIVNALIGVLVAVVAKGREMTATMTLGLIGVVLAIQAALLTVAKTGDFGVLWTLPHTFAFSIMIVVAGATVRTYRSAATSRRAVT